VRAVGYNRHITFKLNLVTQSSIFFKQNLGDWKNNKSTKGKQNEQFVGVTIMEDWVKIHTVALNHRRFITLAEKYPEIHELCNSLWLKAIIFSGKNRTNGFLMRRELEGLMDLEHILVNGESPRKITAVELAEALSDEEVVLFEKEGRNYKVAKYTDKNRTIAEVEESKKHISEVRREAGLRSAAARGSNKSTKVQQNSNIRVKEDTSNKLTDTHVRPTGLKKVDPIIDSMLEVWNNHKAPKQPSRFSVSPSKSPTSLYQKLLAVNDLVQGDLDIWQAMVKAFATDELYNGSKFSGHGVDVLTKNDHPEEFLSKAIESKKKVVPYQVPLGAAIERKIVGLPA